MYGKIVGTGSCAPEKVVTNNDLAKLVETNDQWIRERTGIERRHVAEKEEKESTTALAVQAARNALQNGKTDAEEVDLILLSTVSPGSMVPSISCKIQKAIGAENAVCMDVNAACAGLLFAYQTAQAYITAGMYRKILIVGAETLSSILDWTDRSTCILFGDGAGAMLVEAAEGEVQPAVMHSDGKKGEVLICNEQGHVEMNGQEVFRFAVRKVPEVIGEVLEKAGLVPEDIDCYILHQANKRIIEGVAKRLKVDLDKFPMNLQEYGNTSSASIGILLHELQEEGVLRRGQKLILAGFGAGLSWGAALVTW